MIQIRKFRHLVLLLLVLLSVMILACGCGQENNEPVATVPYSKDSKILVLRGRDDLDLAQISQLDALETLDIRDTGISIADYEALCMKLPNCEILWSVPFQDTYLDSDSHSVNISRLAIADIEAMKYLPCLESVNATGCQDYDALLELQRQYPELEVSYNVFVNGKFISRNTTSLTFDVMDADSLSALLPHFPGLTTVELTGQQPDEDALFAVMADYPLVDISWNLEICGVTVNSLAEEVDISRIRIEDLEAVEASLVRLPRLKKVDMCGCGISNEEMEALNQRHENILFVWEVKIQDVTLRTDITALMPYQYDLWPSTGEAQLFRYFTELECLDLGHHKIYNCDFVAYMPKMKYLLLGDTHISDLTPLAGLTEIIYLEIFDTNVTDYTPLLNLTKLEDLNLCYTEGDPEIIAQMKWVDYIRWFNIEKRKLTDEEQEMLRQALPDTMLELGIFLSSTGGHWRETKNYHDMRDILGMYYMYG